MKNWFSDEKNEKKVAEFQFLPFLLATYGICGKYWFSVEKNEKKNR
jgi:hypothetical protein